MKSILLAIVAFCALSILPAQTTVPNGGLESWTTTALAEPNYYFTANSQVIFGQYAAWPCQRTTDAQLNNYAVRLETQSNGTDTLFGYFANGDPGNGQGGIPYAARPSALTGYWKGNVMTGDTGFVIVMFKLGGNIISTDVYPLYGTAASYTAFTLNINLPIIVVPDSVIVAAVSSNAFVSLGIPGSVVQLDNLVFTGAASQPTLLNGDFESWNMSNYYTADNWLLAGDSAYRTTDAAAGQYAVHLGNFVYGQLNFSPSYLTNGALNPNGPPMGGYPYTTVSDTLMGYYKYSGGAGDSAFLLAVFTGPNVGDTAYAAYWFTSQSVYTFFEVPFLLPFTPDSVAITISSDINNPPNPANLNNVLIIDEIQFASQPLTTGIPLHWQDVSEVVVYPNPSDGMFTIDAKQGYSSLEIVDLTGRVVYSESNASTVVGKKEIDLTNFGSGTYLVNIVSANKMTTRKVIVQ